MLEITKQAKVITFQGEMNRDTVVDFLPFTLLHGETGELIFDLAAVVHVDTAGLAWLLQQISVAPQQSLVVKLRNMPAQLASLATVSDVFTLLPRES